MELEDERVKHILYVIHFLYKDTMPTLNLYSVIKLGFFLFSRPGLSCDIGSVCVPALTHGSTCLSLDVCARHLMCSSNSTCVPHSSWGGQCTQDYECGPGLHCGPDSLCVPTLLRGQDCSNRESDVCGPGLMCGDDDTCVISE